MKNARPRPLKFPRHAVSAVVALCAALEVSAQTERTWTGATSANFGTTTNWSGNAAPGTGTNPSTAANTDIAVFGGTAQAGAITLGSSRNLGGIQFRGANVASYTIGDSSASAYRFYFTLGGQTSMDADVANTQTLLRVGLSGGTGSYTFANNASASTAALVFNSTVLSNTTGAANLVLSGSNTGANRMVGVISENAGAGVLSITKSGSGTWVVEGANTFTGGVTLDSGTLALRNNGALGTGALTVNGGRLGSVVSARTLANPLSVLGNFALGGAGVDTLTSAATTFAGAVNLNGAARTLSFTNSGTFNGVISNGGLVINGTADSVGAVLNAANTYAGGTVVESGRLTTGNASALGAGSLTMSGGELRIAGSAAGSTTLGAGANFSMSGGVWAIELGTAFDQLVGNGGAFSLTGGTLQLDVTGAGFGFDRSYALLSGFAGGSVVSVSFLALNGGPAPVTLESLGYLATLSDAGVLSFAAVPEPSAFAVAAGLGALGLAVLRRRASNRG